MAKEPNFSGHSHTAALVDETGAPITAANPLEVNATVNATASAVSTAAAPTYIEGSTNSLSTDLAGGLRITGTINASSSLHSTTADPSYTNGTDNAFSSNLAGYLRVIAGNFPALVDVNSGNKSNSTLRIAIATDQPQLTNAFKVDGSAVTQPVSGTFWQATQPVSGTFWQATQPISIADGSSVTLGSKADAKSTATDTTAITVMSVLKQISASVQAPPSQAVTNAGTFATQATQAGTWNIGTVTTITGITTAFGATAGTAPANAIQQGLVAATANPTAVTNGQLVGAMSDKVGRQAVVIGGVRDLKANQFTTITSSTAETTVIAAVASTFLDVYGCIVENTSATATKVTFKDSTSGTTQFEIYVPAGDTRGFMLASSDGFKQTTVNNNWTATCGTSVASVVITMMYVKNI